MPLPSRNALTALAVCLLSLSTLLTGQDEEPSDSTATVPAAANTLSISKPAKASHLVFAGRKGILHHVEWAGGQLTLPFKIRSKAENHAFRLTTDVTVGAYFGLTKRLSCTHEHYLTVPVAAGLTFININDDNTTIATIDEPMVESEVVPGLSWCTGLILRLDDYNLGLLFGKDYASDIGDQWIYHGKMWWSFGLGFSFFH